MPYNKKFSPFYTFLLYRTIQTDSTFVIFATKYMKKGVQNEYAEI